MGAKMDRRTQAAFQSSIVHGSEFRSCHFVICSSFFLDRLSLRLGLDFDAKALVMVILIVGALTFFPALALGPIVEHLMLASA